MSQADHLGQLDQLEQLDPPRLDPPPLDPPPPLLVHEKHPYGGPTPAHSPMVVSTAMNYAPEAGQAAALAAKSMGGSRAHIAKSAGAAAGSAVIAAGGSACEAGNAAAAAASKAGGTRQHIVSAAGAAGL